MGTRNEQAAQAGIGDRRRADTFRTAHDLLDKTAKFTGKPPPRQNGHEMRVDEVADEEFRAEVEQTANGLFEASERLRRAAELYDERLHARGDE